MKLNGLIPLYKSMKNQNIGRTKFRYSLNHLDFECLFFIDIEPFELVMGCLHHNFAIFLNIEQGFCIKPFIEPKSTFIKLVKALNTLDDNNHKFVPHDFFDEFNQYIPSCYFPDYSRIKGHIMVNLAS